MTKKKAPAPAKPQGDTSDQIDMNDPAAGHLKDEGAAASPPADPA